MTVRPMLAQSIEATDLPRYINDPNFCMQLKADGQRVLISVDAGQVTALGRNGQGKTSGLTNTLTASFGVFTTGQWCFDGELIGSTLHLFDMVTAQGFCNAATPFHRRYEVLSTLVTDVWQPLANVIQLLPTAWTSSEKLVMARTSEQEHREGVMLRAVNGKYQSGVRSAQLLKCKWVKTVDCIVSAVGVEGKENVELVLLDPDGDRIVNIGRASAIGKKPAPQVGDVWEVKYLGTYSRTDPRLYQPRLMHLRTDKDMSECLIEQVEGSFMDRVLTDATATKTRADM